MRQWRVGTISLGLILLGCGAALLAWSLGGQPLPMLYLRWWPMALIILGLEILASAVWPQYDGKPLFRYDGASIVLIVIIISGSLGLSLLNGLGFLERLAVLYRY